MGLRDFCGIVAMRLLMGIVEDRAKTEGGAGSWALREDLGMMMRWFEGAVVLRCCVMTRWVGRSCAARISESLVVYRFKGGAMQVPPRMYASIDARAL
jgi:hypothetical protein